MSSQRGSQKLLQGLVLAILSKSCKPDSFELHNSLKLSFTNIRGLHLNFVDCKSFLESNSPDILALCETNLDDSIDSGNFSVRGCLPLIWKDSSTHMYGLAVYVKEGHPFAWDLSLKTLQILTCVFDWLYFTQCLTSCSSIDCLFRLCAQIFILWLTFLLGSQAVILTVLLFWISFFFWH